jgi:putative transposase
MVRTFRYRLYPTRAQDERMREFYNAALEQRRDAYRKQGVSVSCVAQQSEIKDVRIVRPEYAAVHTELLQDALVRLDRGFEGFFRRAASGQAPGFPRFKGKGRYASFGYRRCTAPHGKTRWLVAGGKRLSLTGVGNVKIRLHRPMEGSLKGVRVTLAGDGHWYALMCCDDVPAKPLPATGQSVGIDVGITAFATFSNGEQVANPRLFETAQPRMRRAQRVVARRKRGSNRRRKAVTALRALHDSIARKRNDFHHKTALGIVRRFDSIAVEDLNIKGLARMRLAKQVHDAAWGQFVTVLEGKAECAGRELRRVDPRGTSQQCSSCGEAVPKKLGVRVHDCPHCGLVVDRDVNAAVNIKNRPGNGLRGGQAQWQTQ